MAPTPSPLQTPGQALGDGVFIATDNVGRAPHLRRSRASGDDERRAVTEPASAGFIRGDSQHKISRGREARAGSNGQSHCGPALLHCGAGSPCSDPTNEQ